MSDITASKREFINISVHKINSKTIYYGRSEILVNIEQLLIINSVDRTYSDKDLWQHLEKNRVMAENNAFNGIH